MSRDTLSMNSTDCLVSKVLKPTSSVSFRLLFCVTPFMKTRAEVQKTMTRANEMMILESSRSTG